MTQAELNSKKLSELQKIAADLGLKSLTGKSKATLVERISARLANPDAGNEGVGQRGRKKKEAAAQEASAKSEPEAPTQPHLTPAPTRKAQPRRTQARPVAEESAKVPVRRATASEDGESGVHRNVPTEPIQRREPDGGMRQDMNNRRENGCPQTTRPQQPYTQQPNRDYQPRTDRQPRYNRENNSNSFAMSLQDILGSEDCFDCAGVLEIVDSYGFLRTENYYSGSKDIYVAPAQIYRLRLKQGDYVEGKGFYKSANDKFPALVLITKINGNEPQDPPEKRVAFESLTPIFPDERYTLEKTGRRNTLASRLIDLIAPIGKGQRAMIVSQPKAGKTTLLKQIANGISDNNPDAHLIVLLIDERPEEVTDIKRSVRGEVVYSTFDEPPEHHTRVAELVQDRAMRLVEEGKNVVILMDSLTRLTRAYNLVIPPTGRTLSGGMDPGALHKPKRFFGAARNIEGGGSLTIIATALVETGSRMDDIVYEEFKGTGNMEIHLDRKLAEHRIFPAIDIYKSGTRRDDLLLTPAELEGVHTLRRVLSGGADTSVTEQFITMLDKTLTNDEFLAKLKDWVRIYEKGGYSAQKH